MINIHVHKQPFRANKGELVLTAINTKKLFKEIPILHVSPGQAMMVDRVTTKACHIGPKSPFVQLL